MDQQEPNLKREKKRGFWIIVLCAFVIGAGWLLRPSDSFDSTRVDPEISSLQAPYKSVRTAYYLDGGSIEIEIIDATGRMIQIAIPVISKSGKKHEEIYVGTMHREKNNARKVSDPEQTKHMLIQAMKDHSNGDPDIDFIIAELRNRASDYAKVVWHKVLGRYNR